MSNSNADQPAHFITDRVEHPSDLLIKPLPKHYPDAGRSDGVQPRKLRPSSVEDDAAQQFRRQRAVPLSIQRNLVFLFNLVARMSQLLGKIPVVRQEKQSFALSVEATNVEEPREL